MSREVKEKPRGRSGAIQKGKNAALELGRRHASETAAHAREQTKLEQARQEQPEDYANEQVEDGAERGTILAEQVVRSGTKKLVNTGRRDRAGVYERGDPLEKEKIAPDVKERTSEPGDRVREKSLQSERVSEKGTRPVKEHERQTRTNPSTEALGKNVLTSDEYGSLERPRRLSDFTAAGASRRKPTRGSGVVSAETGHTETDASVSHGLQDAIPTDADRALAALRDVRQSAVCTENLYSQPSNTVSAGLFPLLFAKFP